MAERYVVAGLPTIDLNGREEWTCIRQADVDGRARRDPPESVVLLVTEDGTCGGYYELTGREVSITTGGEGLIPPGRFLEVRPVSKGRAQSRVGLCPDVGTKLEVTDRDADGIWRAVEEPTRGR